MALANKRNVEAVTNTVLKLVHPIECVWSEPSRTYGGSFRCWRKGLDGGWKMVLGLNVSGQRKQTPDGQLDIWLPVPSIAAVTGTSTEEVYHALQPLPEYLKEAVDLIVRVKDENQAETIVRVLSEYFEAHPGIYASDGTDQQQSKEPEN